MDNKKNKSLIRPPGTKPPEIPADYKVKVKYPTPVRMIVNGDNHYPIQDKYVEAAKFAFARDFKPDCWVDVGDLYDCWSTSTHDKEPERWLEPGGRLQEEFDSAKDYWKTVCQISKDIHYIPGNHENRISRLIMANPGLFGLRIFDWKKLAEIPDKVHVHNYGAYLEIGGITMEHGEFTKGRFGVAHPAHWAIVNRQRNTIFGHCFDDQTELLTPRGWIKRPDLLNSDQVMTWNRETKLLEYNNIQQIHDYSGYKQLHRIRGTTVDLLVTGKHGLIHHGENGVQYFDAEDFCNRTSTTFLSAGVQNREGVAFTDDEIRLLIWITADGHLDYKPTNSVRFHFKKLRKIIRLRNLLWNLGIEFNEKPQRSGTVKIHINLTERLAALFTWGNKHLPRCLVNATASQARVILEEYEHTDGSRYGQSVQISSAKESELDLLQQLFVTSGYRTTKTIRKNAWIITVNPKRFTTINIKSKPHSTESYNGSVWCVSVDNGTLLVRRNGKVCLTQNTHRVQMYSRTKSDGSTIFALNQGHGSDVSKQKYAGPQPDWQHGFTAIEFWSEGGKPRFTVHPIVIVNGKFAFGGMIYNGKKNQ